MQCPFTTANLPDDSITPLISVAKTGVYYGYAQVVRPSKYAEAEDIKVLPMVMSLGLNPFYKNERLSAVNEYSL
jgi:riboflavin kinase